MNKVYAILLSIFLMQLVEQSEAQIKEEISCSELSMQIDSLNEYLDEREHSWVTWSIKNEDSKLTTVPLEIAKESLTIWNVCGGVPSMLIVFGATYPFSEMQNFLRKKGVDEIGTRTFFNAVSIASMVALYPFGVAVNFISYSAAFTYNEFVKKQINLKLESLNRQYNQSCMS